MNGNKYYRRRDESGFTLMDILLSMVAVSGLAGGGAAIMINVVQDENTKELKSVVQKVNGDYDQWISANPNANSDEKKAHIRETVAALEDSKFFGVAFDSGKSENICMWANNSKQNKIDDAVTASGSEASCAAMETLVTPVSRYRSNQQPVQQPAVAAPAAPTTPAPEFPWSMLFGVLASLGVLGGGAFGVLRSTKKLKELKSSKVDSKRNWDALLERHDVIRREWASYELDPMKMLDYPMLADMREETTVNLHKALRAANNLRPADVKTVVHEDAKKSDYAHAVAELETVFHIAETEAKRVQWNKFSVAEQKRLTTAKSLLSFVLDGGASEFERQAAYKRLNKEISGLITIPKPTMAAIEDQMRVMIEA